MRFPWQRGSIDTMATAAAQQRAKISLEEARAQRAVVENTAAALHTEHSEDYWADQIARLFREGT